MSVRLRKRRNLFTEHKITYGSDDNVAFRKYVDLSNTATGYENEAKHLMRGFIQFFKEYKATLERVTAEINKLYIMLIFGEEELKQLSFSI